jgi:hypothetical protein
VTRRATLLVALCLAGCGGAPERLVGKWEFDPETMNFSPSFRELPQEGKERALAQTRWSLEFTKTELKWDHSMWGWGSLAFKAKYEVESHDGNRVTIKVEPVGKLVFTVTEDRLRFGYKGRPIILKRKK